MYINKNILDILSCDFANIKLIFNFKEICNSLFTNDFFK